MKMRELWNSLCLTSAFALTACGGGGDTLTASTTDQYKESVGSRGERVVILSPTPGQVVRLGENVQFVVRLENVKLHTTPSPTALQAAKDYWQAIHTATLANSSKQVVKVSQRDVATNTAPTVGWLHLSTVASHPTAGTVIAHLQAANISPAVDGQNLIYSLPAADLIGNFSDHHLDCPGTAAECDSVLTGTHLSVHYVDGNPTGGVTSVQINIIP